MNNSNSEYAKALFVLSLEQDSLDQYASCLTEIKSVLTQEYIEYLFSPAEPLSKRLAAIDEAFGSAPEHIVSFLKLVCENGRAKELPLLIDDFFALKKIHQNSITAMVTSAIDLSDSQKERLEKKLTALYKKTITAVYTVDSALIGGMKIEIDGKTLDSSILKKLSLIKGAMNG